MDRADAVIAYRDRTYRGAGLLPRQGSTDLASDRRLAACLKTVAGAGSMLNRVREDFGGVMSNRAYHWQSSTAVRGSNTGLDGLETVARKGSGCRDGN